MPPDLNQLRATRSRLATEVDRLTLALPEELAALDQAGDRPDLAHQRERLRDDLMAIGIDVDGPLEHLRVLRSHVASLDRHIKELTDE
jgi:hypothetical protein